MKSYLINAILLVMCINGAGQYISNQKFLHADENMIMNVKQFGQFVKRFNYSEDFQGNEITPDFMQSFPRNQYIGFLFNANDPRLQPSNSVYGEYTQRINSFIEEVCQGTKVIQDHSENTYIKAICEIKHKNSIKPLVLVLKKGVRDGGICWEIADVLNIGDIASTPDASNENFIPPTSNDVNFTHLKRVFEDKQNFRDYYDENYRNNSLNILNNEVEKGNIEFHHVKRMSYYIFDIEGWVIKVEEFVRNDVNSGWLISNIEKWKKDRMEYLKTR